MRNGAGTHPEWWLDVTGGDHADSVIDALPSYNGMQLVRHEAVVMGVTTEHSFRRLYKPILGDWDKPIHVR